ncbi:MAG: flagellar biosynthesis protein FlhB [Treponema sp.]|jgi:flagellar biosynthetic protein FlhB|nr:flagellar biosynthesis protein FlhB [Treponema sp.]
MATVEMSASRRGPYGLRAGRLEYAAETEERAVFPVPLSLAVIDLQWFADGSEDDETRTEEPTDYKLERAREEGRIAKSQELVGALGLLLPALALFFLAPSMLRTCLEMIRFFMERSVELDPVRDAIIVQAFFSYFVRLALPVVLVAMAAAIFSNVVQVGFLFTVKPIVPDFSRIVPHFASYLRRIFFSMEGFFNFVKSIVKMAIIGTVAYLNIRGEIEKLIRLQTADLWTGITLVAGLAARMMIISALLLLLLSIPDYIFQRWRHRKSLRMSRQEVKEERKMYEADPAVQSRIRGRMRQLLTQNIYVQVPKADVVITNPTHFSVCLEYHAENMDAPMVTAKGEDETALRIRRVARQWDVPVVENVRLARVLYANIDVGELVPEMYLELVAMVYRKVMEINRLVDLDALKNHNARRRRREIEETGAPRQGSING